METSLRVPSCRSPYPPAPRNESATWGKREEKKRGGEVLVFVLYLLHRGLT